PKLGQGGAAEAFAPQEGGEVAPGIAVRRGPLPGFHRLRAVFQNYHMFPERTGACCPDATLFPARKLAVTVKPDDRTEPPHRLKWAVGADRSLLRMAIVQRMSNAPPPGPHAWDSPLPAV